MTGLTKEALLERRKGIGGSDAMKIASGDWHALWLDKTGRVEPEDLSDNFAVQLGIVTEELNLRWAAKKLGPITNRGVVVVCANHPILRCTLDGWVAGERPAVVQAKHVNGFSKIEDVRARYVWQVQHEMIVTGARCAWLSVIIGTDPPALERIDFDDFAAEAYIEACREFWGYVERDHEPERGKPQLAPPAPPPVRKVDMSGSNRWAVYAGDWLANEQPAKLFDAAVKGIKALVEPDVAEAVGHGIVCRRDKRGLSIKRSGT